MKSEEEDSDSISQQSNLSGSEESGGSSRSGKNNKRRAQYTRNELRNVTVDQMKTFTPLEAQLVTPEGYLFFQMRTALMNEIRKQNREALKQAESRGQAFNSTLVTSALANKLNIAQTISTEDAVRTSRFLQGRVDNLLALSASSIDFRDKLLEI